MRKSTQLAALLSWKSMFLFFMGMFVAGYVCNAQVIIEVSEGNRGGGYFSMPQSPAGSLPAGSLEVSPTGKTSFSSGSGSGISFTLAPNPASTTENVTLSVVSGSPTEIKVTDLMATVLYQSPTSSSGSLHTIFLNPGTYYVQLGDGTVWVSQTLVIQ